LKSHSLSFGHLSGKAVKRAGNRAFNLKIAMYVLGVKSQNALSLIQIQPAISAKGIAQNWIGSINPDDGLAFQVG